LKSSRRFVRFARLPAGKHQVAQENPPEGAHRDPEEKTLVGLNSFLTSFSPHFLHTISVSSSELNTSCSKLWLHLLQIYS
jgi:hypothetical protein